MEIGVIFPQTEIEPDVAAIRDFAQAAQDMGYSYLFIADHVLGADASAYDHPLFGMYNHESVVHESLTTMGYLAAVAPGMGLMTGILILPQRQTALVAKQAAEIDVLCSGRLRLGIGVGWNFVEYEALGMNFQDRGARSAEQIEVMRQLWTNESVDFHGKWHDITHAGINPLPVQRPIPVWLGVGSPAAPIPPDVALRRVARIADGWCPNFGPDEAGYALQEKVHGYMAEYGRDPSELGLDGRLKTAGNSPEDWAEEVADWRKMGASHLSIENRRAGLKTAGDHIKMMRRFKEAVEF
ncbi:MAG: LLM class F420-dependent oxidoreductase [Chloroflexi bacterium]|nr:LLM class F420-dependent oxidoreductase [Chloroflexota bacterium]